MKGKSFIALTPGDRRKVDVGLPRRSTAFQVVPPLDEVVEHVALLGEVLRGVAREIVFRICVRLVTDGLSKARFGTV
jgi:hypothetical protein